jgi:hypothetical protein
MWVPFQCIQPERDLTAVPGPLQAAVADRYRIEEEIGRDVWPWSIWRRT